MRNHRDRKIHGAGNRLGLGLWRRGGLDAGGKGETKGGGGYRGNKTAHDEGNSEKRARPPRRNGTDFTLNTNSGKHNWRRGRTVNHRIYGGRAAWRGPRRDAVCRGAGVAANLQKTKFLVGTGCL